MSCTSEQAPSINKVRGILSQLVISLQGSWKQQNVTPARGIQHVTPYYPTLK